MRTSRGSTDIYGELGSIPQKLEGAGARRRLDQNGELFGGWCPTDVQRDTDEVTRSVVRGSPLTDLLVHDERITTIVRCDRRVERIRTGGNQLTADPDVSARP